MRYIDI